MNSRKRKREMGLLVEIPKLGFGNSKGGNCFLEKLEISSRITGKDFIVLKMC